MCIDTVSLPNVSQYGDILIYCCISIPYIKGKHLMQTTFWQLSSSESISKVQWLKIKSKPECKV